MSDPAFIDPSAPAAVAPAPVRDIHQEAFDFDPRWRDQPLEPFTFARQSLAAQLESHSPRIGSVGAANEAYMPHVWAVLWLCSHEPQQWRHLRATPAIWWEVIEAWAEINCTRAEWAAAILLVHGDPGDDKADPPVPPVMGMWDAARANMVMVRRKPGPELPGNGQRQ